MTVIDQTIQTMILLIQIGGHHATLLGLEAK